jgi:redox-sensitive bicupin YhaK (pirin superfamily)
MPDIIIHKADSRGHANHGWINSYHTFSFAQYHHPERIHFGALRVLNDDTVAAGMGFGSHPHDNMEIISIPLSGDLEHRDSIGNTTVIKQGDIQVMSAGTGIVHSEYNKNKDQEVKFLQIWVFPRERNVTPRYGQINTKPEDRQNRLQQIVSPYPDDEGTWIHQDAWFSIGRFDQAQETTYTLHKKENVVYVFLLEGEMEVQGKALERRDGMGLKNTSQITLKSLRDDAEILIMELPDFA